MPIMKKKVYENFTTVNNYFIDDINCKPESKGYLIYMLRKPENWNFTFKSIQKDLGVGERTVRTNIQRLEQLKYLKRERVRGKKGNFEWIYYVYSEPYDLELKRQNLPYARYGQVDGEDMQSDKIIINTNISKDKIDKTKKDLNLDIQEIEHNELTKELMNLGYIDKKDNLSPFYFDELFDKYLLDGKTYRELFSAIHYIVPRVVSRNFIDENGYEITNRYGYFKSSIESNFQKLENLNKDLYSEDSLLEYLAYLDERR